MTMNNFFKPEDEAKYQKVIQDIKATEVNLDKIRGSMIGGAAGDALGYPVEFMSAAAIYKTFGEKGITEYKLDKASGKALISDDTQMTLFTANGILVGETRYAMRGVGGDPHMYMPLSYQDWLVTQETDYETGKNMKRYHDPGGISWFLDVPELYNRRAPGNTCISALYVARHNKTDNDYIKDYIKNPRNNSKGCGGIMRIAPLGLHYDFSKRNISDLDYEGAVLSAITHGHSLGYMPSAVLTHILNRIVYPKEPERTLKEIVIEARDTVAEIFKTDGYVPKLKNIINLVVELSENNRSDAENIPVIGEGWVAEETLGISIYCSLRYKDDFSKGIIAAVNHSGDSDSTGAVTGNILGALLGYDKIEDKWKNDLELKDIILEMADDLCHGCHMEEYSSYYDPVWVRKYIDMHWKEYTDTVSDNSIEDIVNSSQFDIINRMLRNGGNF